MCRQDVKGKVRKGGPVMTMLYRATELAGVRRLGFRDGHGKALGELREHWDWSLELGRESRPILSQS